MLDKSAVGQLPSLSSRTKWQRLSAGDTLRRRVTTAVGASVFVFGNFALTLYGAPVVFGVTLKLLLNTG